MLSCSAAAVALGAIFHEAVEAVLIQLDRLGVARDQERRAASGWIPDSISVRDVAELQLAPGEEVIVY